MVNESYQHTTSYWMYNVLYNTVWSFSFQNVQLLEIFRDVQYTVFQGIEQEYGMEWYTERNTWRGKVLISNKVPFTSL
jgi:hypothetical protein